MRLICERDGWKVPVKTGPFRLLNLNGPDLAETLKTPRRTWCNRLHGIRLTAAVKGFRPVTRTEPARAKAEQPGNAPEDKCYNCQRSCQQKCHKQEFGDPEKQHHHQCE